MEKIAYKINALLNKAHGNTTEAEAQALMDKAFELAAKHNIDISKLGKENKQEYAEYAYSYNQPYVSHEERKAAEIVQRFFFVEVLWKKNRNTGRITTSFFGSKENCEIASYALNFLIQTFERLWKQYRSAKKKMGINVSGGMKVEYVNGMAASVWHKLNSRYNGIETAIVLVKTDLNESFNEQFGKVKAVKSSKGFEEHKLAYNDGRIDGSSISLNKVLQ